MGRTGVDQGDAATANALLFLQGILQQGDRMLDKRHTWDTFPWFSIGGRWGDIGFHCKVKGNVNERHLWRLNKQK